MASNHNEVVSFYSNNIEDGRAMESRARNLEFHYTKKVLSEFILVDSHVIEIGCATGYYGMYFSDCYAHYTGIDLSPENIAVFNKKIADAGKDNISTAVGDATDLYDIPDNTFDVVLCLGPMYHLPREERQKVFDECCRVARTDAVLAFSYINRLGVYAAACLDDKWREEYASVEPDTFILEKNTLESLQGVFFFTSPEEMQHDAKQKNLDVVKNCGLDYALAQGAINRMSEETFALYMKLADRMVESPSCAGLSDHALMICKKQA